MCTQSPILHNVRIIFMPKLLFSSIAERNYVLSQKLLIFISYGSPYILLYTSNCEAQYTSKGKKKNYEKVAFGQALAYNTITDFNAPGNSSSIVFIFGLAFQLSVCWLREMRKIHTRLPRHRMKNHYSVQTVETGRERER